MTSATGHQHRHGLSVPFAGASLDRAGELRAEPSRVVEMLDGSGCAVLAAGPEGILIDRSADPALARRPLGPKTANANLVDPEAPILLGIEDGVALFATDLEQLAAAAREELLGSGEIVSLREAGAILGPAEGGLAAYAVALLNWHRRHRFCANCGDPTAVGQAGLVRTCPACGASHFPRTDPVVIMLVESGGRALLGSRTGWSHSRFSILAGYVSAGETPEEAVIREVREESAITAYAPRYLASQPWPFPSSLMLGFEAQSDGGEPTASDGELTDVRWFTREQLRAAQSGRGEIQLPPPVSIARMLIDRWVALG